MKWKHTKCLICALIDLGGSWGVDIQPRLLVPKWGFWHSFFCSLFKLCDRSCVNIHFCMNLKELFPDLSHEYSSSVIEFGVLSEVSLCLMVMCRLSLWQICPIYSHKNIGLNDGRVKIGIYVFIWRLTSPQTHCGWCNSVPACSILSCLDISMSNAWWNRSVSVNLLETETRAQLSGGFISYLRSRCYFWQMSF